MQVTDLVHILGEKLRTLPNISFKSKRANFRCKEINLKKVFRTLSLRKSDSVSTIQDIQLRMFKMTKTLQSFKLI